MIGYIYKITNKINNKMYIGKHEYTQPYLDEHYITSGVLILKAIDKYGIESFQRELIDNANSLEELNAKEKYWISFYDTYLGEGYNLTSGGDGGITTLGKIKINDGTHETVIYPNDTLLDGWHYGTLSCGENHPRFGTFYTWMSNGITELQVDINNEQEVVELINNGYLLNKRLPMSNEQKLKLSQAKTGVPMNEAARLKLVGHWTGDKNPQRICPKFGEKNSFYGKHHTQESNRKNSEAHKIKYICPFCSYISNHGSVTKHIKKCHNNLIESASTIESIVYEKYIDE